jgi:hypothetical protein
VIPPKKFVNKHPRGRQPSKETTAQKWTAAAQLMPLPHSMTLRDACAIGTQTAMGDRRHAVAFASFCASHQPFWNIPVKIDSLLVTYWNQLFWDGASRSVASQVAAVIRHFSPMIPSRGVSIWPRGHRAL